MQSQIDEAFIELNKSASTITLRLTDYNNCHPEPIISIPISPYSAQKPQQSIQPF
jgi:hypothetical protein